MPRSAAAPVLRRVIRLSVVPIVHEFDPPERFVVGTVGEPGARTFFLQARAGARMVSVALEKQQVSVLAERVDELLDQLLADGADFVPAITPHDLDDAAPLEQPIEEEFRVGTMTLSWDPASKQVVIEVFPITDDDNAESAEDVEPEEIFLVRLQPGMARAFCSRAERVVEAGRAACPFCGNPIDPEGHLCVRANGFRRRPR